VIGNVDNVEPLRLATTVRQGAGDAHVVHHYIGARKKLRMLRTSSSSFSAERKAGPERRPIAAPGIRAELRFDQVRPAQGKDVQVSVM
jgi:hypothetical protein